MDSLPDVQPHQHPLGVGEIPDDLPDGLRQFPYQRRHGNDLVTRRQLRGYKQIDDFNAVLSGDIEV